MKKNQKILGMLLLAVMFLFTMCKMKTDEATDVTTEVTDSTTNVTSKVDNTPVNNIMKKTEQSASTTTAPYTIFYKVQGLGESLPANLTDYVWEKNRTDYTIIQNNSIKEYYVEFSNAPSVSNPWVVHLVFTIEDASHELHRVEITDTITVADGTTLTSGAKKYRKINGFTVTDVTISNVASGSPTQVVTWPPTH